jgi:hypothetical protein
MIEMDPQAHHRQPSRVLTETCKAMSEAMGAKDLLMHTEAGGRLPGTGDNNTNMSNKKTKKPVTNVTPVKEVSVAAKNDEDQKNSAVASIKAADVKSEEAKKPLTKDEQRRLQQHEKVIEEHLNNSFAIGASLRIIHDEELYRGDWDDYCSDKWGFSGSHARRLMDAAKCMDALKEVLSPNGKKVQLPINEAQVRALIELRKESKWSKAWQQVLKATEGKRITAEKIKELLAKKSGKSGTAEAKTLENKEAEEANDAEQKLTKIANLVTKALGNETAGVKALKQVLEKIQKMLGAKLAV